jgi:hypothetical protein
MKMRKLFLVTVPVILLAGLVFASADARPLAANTSLAEYYIANPCLSLSMSEGGSGPSQVYCLSPTNTIASINVPAPWLSSRAPVLSLVNIPTFFQIDWDAASLGFQDSPALTISYPSGDATDRLVNVRFQLRLRPIEASVPEGGLATGNLVFMASPGVFLVDAADTGDVYYKYACAPGLPEIGSPANALLTVLTHQGGYENCDAIQRLLFGMGNPFADALERYPGWSAPAMTQFLAFSPYASIYGAGTDSGSPAFQVSATTYAIVEARPVWDQHEERSEQTIVDCEWEYWQDYDFIDWTRWPDPIYCRSTTVVTWGTYCEPARGNCPYGHPDDWWTSVAIVDASVIRRPDATYSTTYDFASVQSQALLTAP